MTKPKLISCDVCDDLVSDYVIYKGGYRVCHECELKELETEHNLLEHRLHCLNNELPDA